MDDKTIAATNALPALPSMSDGIQFYGVQGTGGGAVDYAVTRAQIVDQIIATGLSAAGNSQGTGLALTAELNEITTVAASAGVVMPVPVTPFGKRISVANAGANALSVYPPSGVQIDALGANAAFSLPVGKACNFRPVSATQYYSEGLGSSLSTPVSVANGGTGASTLTVHGILLGETTSAVVATAAMTNGQLLVGVTSADPAPQTLSGDATLASNGAMTLAASGASAGTYGSVTVNTKGLVTAGTADPGLNFWFGDGSDGTLTYDGSTTILGMAPSSSIYTLTRDIYAATMTVNNGVTIKVNSFRIFCSGTLTNNGTIQFDGGAGATGAAGGGAGSAAGSSTGTVGQGRNGGAGGVNNGTISSGSVQGAVGIAGDVSNSGNSGNGGTGASGGSPAGGRSNAVATNLFTRFMTLQPARQSGATFNMMFGGSGGPGGTSGSNATGQTTGAGTGGGGGAGGGPLCLGAKNLLNAGGTISSQGGVGGVGQNATSNGGGGGGGAGGGGGPIYMAYQSITTGTITAAGGALGAAGTNGGGTGAAGAAGTAGATGFIVKFNTTNGNYE